MAGVYFLKKSSPGNFITTIVFYRGRGLTVNWDVCILPKVPFEINWNMCIAHGGNRRNSIRMCTHCIERRSFCKGHPLEMNWNALISPRRHLNLIRHRYFVKGHPLERPWIVHILDWITCGIAWRWESIKINRIESISATFEINCAFSAYRSASVAFGRPYLYLMVSMRRSSYVFLSKICCVCTFPVKHIYAHLFGVTCLPVSMLSAWVPSNIQTKLLTKNRYLESDNAVKKSFSLSPHGWRNIQL